MDPGKSQNPKIRLALKKMTTNKATPNVISSRFSKATTLVSLAKLGSFFVSIIKKTIDSEITSIIILIDKNGDRCSLKKYSTHLKKPVSELSKP